MGKKDITVLDAEHYSFPKLKSYSVDEIMAAGGTIAFTEKMGKSWESLIDRSEKLPKEAFLTDKEVETALKMLRQSNELDFGQNILSEALLRTL